MQKEGQAEADKYGFKTTSPCFQSSNISGLYKELSKAKPNKQIISSIKVSMRYQCSSKMEGMA